METGVWSPGCGRAVAVENYVYRCGRHDPVIPADCARCDHSRAPKSARKGWSGMRQQKRAGDIDVCDKLADMGFVRAPSTLRPGDLLAIHASARKVDLYKDGVKPEVQGFMAEVLWPSSHKSGHWLLWKNLPRGRVVAVCEFLACHRTEAVPLYTSSLELFFGDWKSGRHAWELRVVLDLSTTPIPAKGRQGLWEWEPPASTLDDLPYQVRASHGLLGEGEMITEQCPGWPYV